MHGFVERLESVRKALGLSLRQMEEALRERAAYAVSHDSIRRYELGSTVPAGYLRALRDAFGVSVLWLLFGDGEMWDARFDGPDPPDVDEMTRQVRNRWDAFLDALDPELAPRRPVRDSWLRLRESGLDFDDDGGARFRRLPPAELRRRVERLAPLGSRALPHLEWISRLLHDLPHAAALVDPAGAVLRSVGPDPERIRRWGLAPGCDWSEEALGTNGAGTALESGTVAAVIGAEHLAPPLQRLATLGAPVREADESTAGAVLVATRLRHAEPRRLLLGAYAAETLERELREGDPGS